MKDAERSVIGCLLMQPDLMDSACKRLGAKMFEDEQAAELFRAMLTLRKRGKPIDAVTVLSLVGEGYKQAIAECAETAPSIGGFESYRDIVLEAWRVRELQAIASGILYDGENADTVTRKLAAEVRHQYDIMSAVQEGTEKDFKAAMESTFAEIMKKDTSLKTGMPTLDTMTGGFQRGCLYILAARPGQGKTDFALQLAVMLSQNYSARYQSMEMTTEQLMQRVLSRSLQINSIRIRDKQLDEKDFAKLELAAKRMTDLRIVFDDRAALTCEDVRSIAERAKPDAMVLDYLGLMRGDPKKQPWDNTAEQTHALKALAKERNMVVLALVQQNRNTDRENKRPKLADLYGGAAVEADADGVIFLLPEPMEGTLSGDEVRRTAAYIAKNRYGCVGDVNLAWQPQYHRYTPLEEGRTE